MALKEQDIVFTDKDASGNTIIQMPITRKENVEGLEEALNSKQPVGDYAIVGHGHAIGDVTDLQGELDGIQEELDEIQVALDGKQPVGNYVTSVNGIAPTEGNVTVPPGLSALDVYPVGAIYMSVVATSPATLFGGTWEALNQGRVLIGANSTYPAGSTGGEATVTLTTDQMPSHSHSAWTDSQGWHTHGISYVKRGDGDGAAYNPTSDGDYKGSAGSGTDGAGEHTHNVGIANTGGGKAHNNMQPYLSVYMWKRTA